MVKSVRIWSFLIRIFLHWDIYEDLLCKSPYSLRMRENTDQKNSEYGQFPRSSQEIMKLRHFNATPSS